MSRRWPYPKGDRDWPTYLHWWAMGDELPDIMPDWLLDRWPNRLLNRLVCRIWGHTMETDLVAYCIWCQQTPDDPAAPDEVALIESLHDEDRQ